MFCPRALSLLTASAFLALSGSIAWAEQGMVLVMQGDGSLVASTPQQDFARNYNDGVGQGSASDALSLFGQHGEETGDDDGSFRVAAILDFRQAMWVIVAIAGIAAAPTIVAAIWSN